MQDVDRPPDVERLPQRGRAQRLSVQAKPRRVVPRSERLNRIVRDRWKRRDILQEPPVRPPETERAVGQPFYLVALFVDGAVMTPTQHREVRERGRPAVGPVTDVVTLAERHAAARKAATVVAVVERAP